MSKNSVIRENLLTQKGYTPYCGNNYCGGRWPRTHFDGQQFRCSCGFRTTFEPEFIEKYKAAQRRLEHATSLSAMAAHTGQSTAK